ncbi:ABC transporter permease [Humibacter ginsenosidimutans]|uniref:Transport permease protein n=1 Tax=Humibacter ginsenosidimutans TaxID=2599293 RepID=A0A5B8M8B1_9MICO|nr:ABC transporter permease [Humibacter ginsenosidimutans]QDZ16264.1 ABC transporter permease [Humibacter ginsenosidimutans]
MTPIAESRTVRPFGAFNLTYLWIELKRKLRNRRTLVLTLVFPVALYLLVGYPQRNVPLTSTPVDQGGISVAAYLMVSMALYGAMMSATAAGGSVAIERTQGWSRQLRLTPVSPVANVATKIVAGLVVGLIAVLATFAVGAITGVRMPVQDWLLAGLAVWLLGTLVFTALGLMIGYLVPSENAMQFVSLAIVLLSFVGGLFIPVSQMPDVMREIAVWTPVYGIGELGRAPLTGEAFNVLALLNAIAWLAVFAAGTALLFRRDTRRG